MEPRSAEILDVDLLAFERGSATQRRAVVDGVRRSLTNGFVFTSHDMSEDLLDTAYGMLREFFSQPAEVKQRSVATGSHGQRGYTGLLVETAATSDAADWKEMLNWGAGLPEAHPLRRRYPHRYMDPVFPEADVPGISAVLSELHERTFDIQRRFLRIIAVGLGAHENFFDSMVKDGTTLTRAIRYPPMAQAPESSGLSKPHVWAGAHGDINLITALPRATARGLQVLVDGDPDVPPGEVEDSGNPLTGHWVDAVPPEGHCIINTGIMLERLTNGVIPVGVHQVVADPDGTEERYSVVQFCHPTPWTILAPMHECIGPNSPTKYAGIEAGDLLDEVIYAINLVEDGRRIAQTASHSTEVDTEFHGGGPR
ncbi:MAG TPA: 2-oxoglutarate and iron-dependent oxygenase domain-containing protein [Microthrixaceae bacterium]|nr:2-oxoglutarate and iron-dependent oxygenase domain-containing protein [Microthrixaceae bacterium]